MMLGKGQKSQMGYDRVDKQDKTIQNSTGYVKPVSKCTGHSSGKHISMWLVKSRIPLLAAFLHPYNFQIKKATLSTFLLYSSNVAQHSLCEYSCHCKLTT